MRRVWLGFGVVMTAWLAGCDESSPHVDKSRLGAACGSAGSSGLCRSGETCANYAPIDPSISTPVCVAAQNPCDVVDCDGKRCATDDIAPPVIRCE